MRGSHPAETDYIVWDVELPGFGVRVKPSGVRSYVVQYRNRNTGTSRRKTLGQHGPLLTFHKARERARIILADALSGNDPVADDHAMRNAPTMKALAADYLAHHAVPKKRPRSVQKDRSMLDRIILPRLGGRNVNAVQSRDVQALHAAMKETPYQANRVLALMSKMFSLAVQWGLASRQPGPKASSGTKKKGGNVGCQMTNLKHLLGALSSHPNRCAANAVRFQLLTGARIGEVLTARWSDVDLDRGVWTKPSHHTKQKRIEHLPLSAPTIALLEEMRERTDASEHYLFPGDGPDKPLQGIRKFWCEITQQIGLENYRLHDNRHTHASHLVSSGLSLEIVGRLLGHTSPLTTNRYAHLADDPLRAAVERFGSKVEALNDKGRAEVVSRESPFIENAGDR